ncbi:MAG TPA: complex I NDUFA9 subunit family protein [Abditibacteriaceae bacterium]|jgi:NADH dehydrogenase
MIFLTGATGFIGSHLARHLGDAGVPLRVLVREHSRGKKQLEGVPGIEFATGDVLQPESLREGVQDCDTIIHLVGIIKETKQNSFHEAHVEATRNVLAAAKQNGIKRYIHMSALGTRAHTASQYHRTKWQAEELVRASGLNWTIFRPSLVYGEGSEFIASMLPLVKAPITPIISPGMDTGLLQPLHIDDLCACFVQAAQDSAAHTFGQTYECGGPDRLTTEQILGILAALSGRSLRKVKIPLALARLVMGSGEKLGLPVPATPQQLLMLQENNVCDISGMRHAFGIEPRRFREGVAPLLRDSVKT